MKILLNVMFIDNISDLLELTMINNHEILAIVQNDQHIAEYLKTGVRKKTST